MSTYLVSAFWHGFYPFYYVMFFFCALFGEIVKDFWKVRALFACLPYPLNSIVANILSMTVMNFLGISFGLLTFEAGWQFSKNVHHIIYFSILVTFCLFRMTPLMKILLKKDAQIRKQNEERQKAVDEKKQKKE